MDLKICSTTSDLNEAYNVRDRATWDPEKGTTWADISITKKLYVIFDDREDRVEVVDNRKELVRRIFTEYEFDLFMKQLLLDASKKIFPEGESK